MQSPRPKLRKHRSDPAVVANAFLEYMDAPGIGGVKKLSLRKWVKANCWWDVSDTKRNRLFQMNYPSVARAVSFQRERKNQGLEPAEKFVLGRPMTFNMTEEEMLCGVLMEIQMEFGKLTKKTIICEVSNLHFC